MSTQRPCLVLIPTHTALSHRKVTPSVVPIEDAHQWDESPAVGDEEMCHVNAFHFCVALGINEHNPVNRQRVISIVREHLGDLLMCPPLSDHLNRVVADAIHIDRESGKVTEREITSNVH